MGGSSAETTGDPVAGFPHMGRMDGWGEMSGGRV